MMTISSRNNHKPVKYLDAYFTGNDTVIRKLSFEMRLAEFEPCVCHFLSVGLMQ